VAAGTARIPGAAAAAMPPVMAHGDELLPDRIAGRTKK